MDPVEQIYVCFAWLRNTTRFPYFVCIKYTKTAANIQHNLHWIYHFYVYWNRKRTGYCAAEFDIHCIKISRLTNRSTVVGCNRTGCFLPASCNAVWWISCCHERGFSWGKPIAVLCGCNGICVVVTRTDSGFYFRLFFFSYRFQLRIDFSLYPLRERPRKLQKDDPFSYLSCGLFKLLFIFLPNSFYISRFPYACYVICIIIWGLISLILGHVTDIIFKS